MVKVGADVAPIPLFEISQEKRKRVGVARRVLNQVHRGVDGRCFCLSPLEDIMAIFARFSNQSEGPADTLVNAFGLRTYKSATLLTPRVRAEQLVFALMLSAMLFVDGWAWFRAWSYGLTGQFVIPLVLGTVFAVAAVLFDRSVIVADTTNSKGSVWWSIGGRAFMLLLISALTAVPVELAVFESEISQVLDESEKLAADKVRNQAIEVETVALSQEISELTAQLSSDSSVTQANADGDMIRLQQDRARERTQLLEQMALNRGSLEKALSEKSAQVALEAAGKGPSGRYGNGPAFQAMKQQESEARQALADFNTKASAEVAAFDRDTNSRLVSLRATRDKTVAGNQANAGKLLNQKRAEKRKKVEEIRTMSYDKLATLYGGSWRVAKGFLARFRVLEEMSSSDESVNAVKWGCRVAMILLGLFVLGLKLLASDEFKRYYSLAAQAAAGDEDAQSVVKNMGYDEFANHGLTTKARELLIELHAARQQVWKAMWDLDRRLANLAKPDATTNLCKSSLQIEGELHSVWVDKGAEALATVNSLEERIKLVGETIPAWPDKLGKDPRITANGEPWKISAKRLASFGWKSPDTIVEAAITARQQMIDARRELRKVLNSQRRELHALIAGNPGISKQEVESLQRIFYDDRVFPVLERIDAAETLIMDAGKEVPAWPSDFPDPRKDLFERLCRLEERDLRETYGWEGQKA